MDARALISEALCRGLEYGAALRGYAIHLAGADNSDDLLQDLCVRALEQAGKLTDERNVDGWLKAMMFHLFVDQHRRRKRRAASAPTGDLDWAADLCHAERGTQAVDAIDLQVAVERFLSPEQVDVLRLMLQGHNTAQVAKVLGVPTATVLSRRFRAKRRLGILRAA